MEKCNLKNLCKLYQISKHRHGFERFLLFKCGELFMVEKVTQETLVYQFSELLLDDKKIKYNLLGSTFDKFEILFNVVLSVKHIYSLKTGD